MNLSIHIYKYMYLYYISNIDTLNLMFSFPVFVKLVLHYFWHLSFYKINFNVLIFGRSFPMVVQFCFSSFFLYLEVR